MHLEPDNAQLLFNIRSNHLVSRLKPAYSTGIKGTQKPILGRSAAMQRFQRLTPLARLRSHASLLSGRHPISSLPPSHPTPVHENLLFEHFRAIASHQIMKSHYSHPRYLQVSGAPSPPTVTLARGQRMRLPHKSIYL